MDTFATGTSADVEHTDTGTWGTSTLAFTLDTACADGELTNVGTTDGGEVAVNTEGSFTHAGCSDTTGTDGENQTQLGTLVGMHSLNFRI